MRAEPIRLALTAVLVVLPASARADSAPETRYRTIIERPLFSPTRRPPPTRAATVDLRPPASPPAVAAPSFTLSGVISGGGGGIALVRRPQDTAPIHLGMGVALDGWTVTEIHPRAVVLRRDGRSVVVNLPAPGR